MKPEDFGVRHIGSPLMRESLMDKGLLVRTDAPTRSILPNLNVVQIGGRSIVDRGRTALMPVLDEIVDNQEKHQQVIGVGSGIRSRHILSVGLDLGLPTGALATLMAGCRRTPTWCPAWRSTDSYTWKRLIVQLLRQCWPRLGAVFNGIRPTRCGNTRRPWENFRRTVAMPDHTLSAKSSARATYSLEGRGRPIYRRSKTDPDAGSSPKSGRGSVGDAAKDSTYRTGMELLARAAWRSIRIVNGLVPGNSRASTAAGGVGDPRIASEGSPSSSLSILTPDNSDVMILQ
jgi:hypothetical protein